MTGIPAAPIKEGVQKGAWACCAMLTTNPYALLAEVLPPAIMQAYIVAMIAAVVVGTLVDLSRKRSAEFFAQRRRLARAAARRELGAGEVAALALRTLGHEVAAAGEFCKWPRRLSHLLTAYGFVIYVATTVLLAFLYPTAARTPALLTALWNLGALMILAGGGWFFFFLKANVAYERHSPFRLTQADLFIGALLASTACGLLWHFAQTRDNSGAATWLMFALYIFFTTLLFGSVPWSKFAHMFYKPAAALQKRIEEADGSSGLPRPADKSFIAR